MKVTNLFAKDFKGCDKTEKILDEMKKEFIIYTPKAKGHSGYYGIAFNKYRNLYKYLEKARKEENQLGKEAVEEVIEEEIKFLKQVQKWIDIPIKYVYEVEERIEELNKLKDGAR